jgi:hypothetical protein
MKYKNPSNMHLTNTYDKDEVNGMDGSEKADGSYHPQNVL